MNLYLNFSTWFLNEVFNKLPQWSLPDQAISALVTFYGLAYRLNAVFPVRTLFVCFGVIAGYHFVTRIVDFILGVAALLRGSGRPEVR